MVLKVDFYVDNIKILDLLNEIAWLVLIMCMYFIVYTPVLQTNK